MKTGLNAVLTLALLGAASAAAAEVPLAADQVSPLLIGAAVPEVTVRDAAGAELSLAEAAGMKPSILIFYRGGW